MTETTRTIKVLLESDTREDELEGTLNAIGELRGVRRAEPGEPSEAWAPRVSSTDECLELLTALSVLVEKVGVASAAKVIRGLVRGRVP